MFGEAWMFGAGNMGLALLQGWSRAGIDTSGLAVIDPGEVALPDGSTSLRAIPDGKAPQLVILAVKPQSVELVGFQLRGRLSSDAAIWSFMAGTRIARLRELLQVDDVVRFMPNLPVSICKGAIAYHSPRNSAELERMIQGLLAPLGVVEQVVDEDQLDAATALSGCGPAFVYRFIDALGKAARGLGLPQDQATRIALAVVSGASATAARSAERVDDLAERVASQGGATRAGLAMLDDNAALDVLVGEAIAAAMMRSRELGAA